MLFVLFQVFYSIYFTETIVRLIVSYTFLLWHHRVKIFVIQVFFPSFFFIKCSIPVISCWLFIERKTTRNIKNKALTNPHNAKIGMKLGTILKHSLLKFSLFTDKLADCRLEVTLYSFAIEQLFTGINIAYQMFPCLVWRIILWRKPRALEIKPCA